MKTAISIPDDMFERAEKRAHELHISRSRLYAAALSHYLDRLDANSLTNQINESLISAGTEPPDDGAALPLSHTHLLTGDDW